VGARPAIALGGLRRGVTPLEQAAAFATFAARGTYAEPYAITSIVDREGRVVYEREPRTERAFDEKEVGVLNDALLGVVRDGTGRGAAIGRPVAGKTGTTQEYGDAWFVGFVPRLATAVWVGHPDGIVPMTDVHGRRVTGGSFPAAIFAGTMRTAVEGLPAEEIHTASPDDLNLKRSDQPPPRPAAPATVPTTAATTLPAGAAPYPTVATLPPPTTPFPTFAPVPSTAAPRPGATTTIAATTTTAPATTTTTAATTTTTTAATTTTTTTTAPPRP
jgi:penicillin-binding protein 1A